MEEEKQWKKIYGNKNTPKKCPFGNGPCVEFCALMTLNKKCAILEIAEQLGNYKV